MSLYVMADFHLCFGANDKPMDIFGKKWEGYMEKIEHSCKCLKEEDTLVIPGDISWATYLSSCVEDLKFIDALPGRKIISKGNHDYWWTSAKKLGEMKEKYGLKSIHFLHNNYYMYEDICLCGNRGWVAGGGADDKKIYDRELMRLEFSLKSAPAENEKIVFTHFPVVSGNVVDNNVLALLVKNNVKRCYYGHLHGIEEGEAPEGKLHGIEFKLVSADYLNFIPYKII